MKNSTSGQLVRDNNGSATVHRGDKRLISHVVIGQRQGFGSFLTLLLLLLLCGAMFSCLFHYRSNLSPDDYSALVARYRGIDDDVDSTVNSNEMVVDLSKNDPALQGLKQAACRTFLAPSLAGASNNHRRWGVYTAWDLPRKAAAQPVADTCWVVELPSQKDDETADDWHWLVSATVPSLSKGTTTQNTSISFLVHTLRVLILFLSSISQQVWLFAKALVLSCNTSPTTRRAPPRRNLSCNDDNQ